MGSSGEDPNKGIDAAAGGLVWVRRRNGSWWPGKILGPDELPEGCVPAPRSGTPVKLLGREDASVDWYNLEKSRRVKAFHCGEYDDCIEKAKASASHPSKKVVKYARREDAILHALELESARLGKDHRVFSASPDGTDHDVNDSPSFEESEDLDEDLESSNDESDLAQELSPTGLSFEELDHVDSAKEELKQWRTPNDSEDDGAEGVKRMRGLEDLGLGVASSPKRKRSQVAHVHEFLKRRNRRRTLTKVLECTTMVSVPVVCEQLSSPTGSSVPVASDSKVSGLECNESKNNNLVVINNNSDSNGVPCENGTSLNASDAPLRCKEKDDEISSMPVVPDNESSRRLFEVPLVTEEKQPLVTEEKQSGLSPIVSGASQKTPVAAGAQLSQSSHVIAISLAKEEHNESGSTSSGTANVHMKQRIEKGTSEWQLKGKRNSRTRKLDIDDEPDTHAASVDQETFLASSSGNMESLVSDCRLVTQAQVEECRAWRWNAPKKESHTRRRSTPDLLTPQRSLPYRQSRFTVNPKYDDSDFSLRHHIVGSGLFDVPLDVKTGYQPQHVPYISLMSKLTGRPITGHPLTVEPLEDDFFNDLFNISESYSSSSELEGVGTAYEDKARGRTLGKHAPFPHSRTKPSRSRRNGLLSKKIRKLSSLTGSHRLSREDKKPLVEKLKGPSIACIPLNVVFSRINAALNSSVRPPSRLVATSSV